MGVEQRGEGSIGEEAEKGGAARMLQGDAQTLYQDLFPVIEAAGLELVDVELDSHTLRVTVEREGGVDLDALAAANRAVSAVLDGHDPFPGSYTLEVSSPGLDRRLRRPEHFKAAVGSVVTVRTVAGTAGARRVRGVLRDAGTESVVVEDDAVPGGTVEVPYGAIERARTVFQWGPAPAAPSPSRAAPRGARRRAVTP